MAQNDRMTVRENERRGECLLPHAVTAEVMVKACTTD